MISGCVVGEDRFEHFTPGLTAAPFFRVARSPSPHPSFVIQATRLHGDIYFYRNSQFKTWKKKECMYILNNVTHCNGDSFSILKINIISFIEQIMAYG